MMATPFDPRLSPSATETNQINWLGLRVFMEEHFRGFTDTTVRIFDNVDSSDICPYILQHKICPSLFTDFPCCALYHPEFIVRNDEIQWLPRTWVCRAFQRSILPDGSGVANCPIPQCQYAHAGLWSTSEQLAFRALALRTHQHNMGLLYHLQPTASGTRPLERISSSTALHILQTQPFLTLQKWGEYKYRANIPPPPTYSSQLSQVSYLFAHNWTPNSDVPHRSRRSTTPRRSTRSVTPTRSTSARPQQIAPTMPVSPTDPAPLDEFELVTNSRWGSRNRTPTPTPRNPSATSSSQTTPQDDVWQTFTQHYDTVTPTRNLPINTVPDVIEEDSDGLEFPPSDLQLNRPPVLYHNQTQPAPAPEPEFRLQPVLATLANTANYNPIAITGSDNSYNIPHVPAIFLRHTYPSAPGDINLATTSNPLWQLPSNILYQLYNMTPQNQQHTIQQAITPWGLFTRMGLRDATNQHTHYEQSLTVPFATNTSSPELAIIRWLMHQRITHERQRVTHDFFTDLQRNRNLQPGSYYNAVARDWITTAADIYRATRGQNSPARTTFRSMAQTILDLINDTTQPEERYMVTETNITIDDNTGRLIFVER